MTEIPNAAQKVPMMFRAQTAGRCQLQRIARDAESDVERWTDEWTDRAHPVPSSSPQNIQTKTYTLSWRFVTNGGQDDGIIRPVIGAFGLPYYPGSSMKGVFRRVCTPQQADRYCGKKLTGGDFEPGILRFHGGYPTDDRWQEGLVDIVHPQQNWQVKSDRKDGGAFALISLYKPTLRFGISSTKPEKTDWEEVWELWERAIAQGLGCRVCAGYGQPSEVQGKRLYRCTLKGQGAAPKLLNDEGEFRPNLFRASVRGHALRIFGGLCQPREAEDLVQTLFGGVKGNATVGLLAMNFRDTRLSVQDYGTDPYAVPAYQVEGQLNWLLTRELPPEEKEALIALMRSLMRFSMLLGGFGKSWRRTDHRLFYPEYYEGRQSKALIGCHWQWTDRSLMYDSRVRKLEQVGQFIDDVRKAAKTWMEIQGVAVHNSYATGWREAWHPDKVQVWGREAEDDEDCEAVRWFHGPYRRAIREARIPEGSIYRTSVAGSMNQVGRLWHRMYPIVRLVKDPKNPKKPIAKKTRRFLELLTFFPNGTPESDAFLTFLESEQQEFQKLWIAEN
ncbi:RAMP superfamily protein [Lusitaniella coriacea]|uniref:RAMP superfamily protein n=1 Tax=Lusitaniella coriacea TaxID=1983105 RepID=UPI003CEE9F1F